MDNIIKRYTNGEITVTWQPSRCIHSAMCISTLPQVFDIHNRPWVTIGGATSQQIADAIDLCPSGALSYEWNKK